MFISAQDFLNKLQPVVDIWRSAMDVSGFIHHSKIKDQLHNLYLMQKQDFTFDITWLEDFREQKLFETNGQKVVPLVDIQGRILLTNERIYFQPFNNISSKPVKKWNLADAKRVVKRRHLLRQTGIEIFFSDSSIFFSFQNKETRDHVYLLIMKQPALSNVQINDQVNVTELWQNGHISNFDYLMYLNFMADRTFNDLTQLSNQFVIMLDVQITLYMIYTSDHLTPLPSTGIQCFPGLSKISQVAHLTSRIQILFVICRSQLVLSTRNVFSDSWNDMRTCPNPSFCMEHITAHQDLCYSISFDQVRHLKIFSL